ncbi:MAG: O-antigen ligase family protein [Gemmatimonadetes bacterium]|nr:O-antigen ligase family protein [Gemmatimonadota bacterium]
MAPRRPGDASAPGRAPWRRGHRLRQWRATVSNSDLAAWAAVAAFSCYVTMALAGGGGRSLTITFPLGCLLVAVFCYARSPATYVGFVFWTWILTPFLRRVFDLHFGFHPASPLLVGPVLATAVSGLTLLRYATSLRRTTFVPFALAMTALLYAYIVGLFQQSVVAATYDLLNWGAPLLFGLHLALEWRRFPRMRSVMTKVALWGLLATGLYALVQFVDPPAWDRAWVVGAEMYSVGVPVPFLIRVFSTLNAPGPYGVFLIFAVLIGLPAPQRWKFLALALGLTALLLTKTRSAWAAFLLGALVLQLRQPLRNLPRQWIALAVVLLLAAPAITHPRVMRAVAGRAASLASIEDDRSYRERLQITNYVVGRLQHDPVGSGLGLLGGAGKLQVSADRKMTVGALDSGVLEIFSVMGWMGGTLYTFALFGVVFLILRERSARRDAVANGAAAAVIAILAAAFFGNVFNGVSGLVFWSAVGFAIAGQSYALAVEQARRLTQLPGAPIDPAYARNFAA